MQKIWKLQTQFINSILIEMKKVSSQYNKYICEQTCKNFKGSYDLDLSSKIFSYYFMYAKYYQINDIFIDFWKFVTIDNK